MATGLNIPPPEPPERQPPLRLPPYQERLLRLMQSGATLREIVQMLGVSPRTLANYRRELRARVQGYSGRQIDHDYQVIVFAPPVSPPAKNEGA